ncbi:hypothetical protein HK096_006523, partial [Nowakowskiella sp. JEL0078]
MSQNWVIILECFDIPTSKNPWGTVTAIFVVATCLLTGIAIGYLHAILSVLIQWLFALFRCIGSGQTLNSGIITMFPLTICIVLVLPDIYRRDLERRQGYKKSKILNRENRNLIIRQQEVDTLLELALPAHVAKILRLFSDGIRPLSTNGQETPYAALSLRVESATVMFAEFHFLQVHSDSKKSTRSMVNAMNFVFSKVDDYLQRVPSIEKIK